MSRLKFDKEPVFVTRSDRKTISAQIKNDGIYVRAPRAMSDREVQAFLESKRKWLEAHLRQREAYLASVEQVQPYTREEIEALADCALSYIPPRVAHYAKLLGVTYGRITIRNQRTRWGSCSSDGNLNFNCLLMEFPPEVIDSVVVHELCHRKHMNHSPQFYAEIDRVFPNYKQCRQWLKENGGRYLARLR